MRPADADRPDLSAAGLGGELFVAFGAVAKRRAVPGGWHLATASLTASISDPREILAVATFLLGRGDGICDALERVPPGEGFVTVQERGRGA